MSKLIKKKILFYILPNNKIIKMYLNFLFFLFRIKKKTTKTTSNKKEKLEQSKLNPTKKR